MKQLRCRSPHFTRVRISLLLLATMGPALSAAGQTAGLSSRICARMKEFVDQGQISGSVTLVGRRDRVVSLEAVGLRSIEDGLPMRPDTLFRIASMTKPITAIGVLMLVEEGKLALDDPVETHLPEFLGQMMVAARSEETITLEKPRRAITLRDLLTHTSGLPAAPPPGLSDLYSRRNHTLAEAVLAFSQRPLDFEPGTRWAYCSPGIDTLGRVIEVVSGQSYERFLRERLFDPLGMRDTTFDPSPEQVRRAAVVYERKGGALRPVAAFRGGLPEGARNPLPAGGLFSTAPDLARLYQMLLRGGTAGGRRYLSESTLAEMTRVQTGDLKAGFSEGIGFGLGWSIVRQPVGVTDMLTPGAYGHGGGYGTQCWIDPRRGLFTILLTQRPDLNPRDEAFLRRQLPEIAFAE
jgi:CubicO group peptidase (beta-lactamase class C family)